MATWTTMNDLSTGSLVTESDMDALRGNIEYLLAPTVVSDTLSSFLTNSITYVDTGLEVTITTNGGLVEVFLTGMGYRYATVDDNFVQLLVDGVQPTEGERTFNSGNTPVRAGIALYWSGVLSTGSHTFKIQTKVTTVGTYSFELHDATLFVKEA